MKNRTTPVVILGGGFAGAMVGYHLAVTHSVPSAVIEPRPSIGLGAAYSTTRPTHLLNVPCDRMGATAGDPKEFYRWLTGQGIEASGDDFVQRGLFGQYVRAKLSERQCALITHVRATAEQVRRTSETTYAVRLDNGESLTAEQIVLAAGNQAPELPTAFKAVAAHSSLIANPWADYDLTGCDQWKHVTIIGTGLTAVDFVLDLFDRGFSGELLLLSRRGLLPRPHLPPGCNQPPVEPPRGTTIRHLLHEIRKASTSSPWQSVIDSLRPRSSELWATLGHNEQARFLRHAKPYWEVHRHRIPQATAATLDALTAMSKLRVTGARLMEVKPEQNALTLTFLPRRSALPVRVTSDRVVNCAGPSTGAKGGGTTFGRMVAGLFSDGLACPDDHGLGLRVNDRFQLVDITNSPTPGLYTLGGMLKGGRWETTAVRELREQAESVARVVAGALTSRRVDTTAVSC